MTAEQFRRRRQLMAIVSRPGTRPSLRGIAAEMEAALNTVYRDVAWCERAGLLRRPSQLERALVPTVAFV
ncbi:MAG: hypothetical protein M3Q74_06180 [Pseudomonadota bacterium]|nr:hypothetical protein [Pseudomonadota bacterium]